jgi:HK97 family phage major capsid protein
MNLGPRVIPAQGNVSIPKATAGCTAYWVSGDFEDLTEGNPTYSSVSLTPKFCGAYTRYSLKMAAQSGIVEDVIRRDLAAQLAQEIDKQAIQGDGSGSKITGIINVSGINAGVWSSSPVCRLGRCPEAERCCLMTWHCRQPALLRRPGIWKQLRA